MRNRKEIKKWMIDIGKSVADYGRELEVNPTLVTNTIAGRKNNRKVLRALVADGCPTKYLDLPEDMRRAA